MKFNKFNFFHYVVFLYGYLLFSFLNTKVSNSKENNKTVVLYGHKFYGNLKSLYEVIDKNYKCYFLTLDYKNYKKLQSKNINVLYGIFPKDLKIVIDSKIFVTDHGMHYFKKFLKNDENRLVTIDEYDIFLLNSNFKKPKDYEDILNKISSSDKVKVIFTHNVIFSKSNWILRTNGRDYYDLGNQFYDELPKEKDLTIVAGDVGAIKGTPYLTYYKKNETHLLSSGLGNGNKNFAIEIILDPDEISFFKLNLDNNNVRELKSSYLTTTAYNFIYYFFLSRKRAVIFFLFMILIYLINRRKTLFKKLAKIFW